VAGCFQHLGNGRLGQLLELLLGPQCFPGNGSAARARQSPRLPIDQQAAQQYSGE